MILSDNLKGAGFMMGAMAGFAVNDALMKSLAGEVPLYQAIFLRGVFTVLLVGAVAWRRGLIRLSALAPVDRAPAALRAVAEIGATICFLTALFNMPIADATAILQFTPLALTLIAALVLRERTSLGRWLAVAAGFFGVLLILRPGAEGANSAAFWALGAVVAVVARDLATRRISAATPSMAVTLMAAIAITGLGAVVTAFSAWAPVSAASILVLAGSALFLFAAYYCSVGAMRVGEIGFVSPFRYSIMVWAILLGVLVFGDRPDAAMLIGAAIVVAAGLYTFFDERRSRRSALRQPDPAQH